MTIENKEQDQNINFLTADKLKEKVKQLELQTDFSKIQVEDFEDEDDGNNYVSVESSIQDLIKKQKTKVVENSKPQSGEFYHILIESKIVFQGSKKDSILFIKKCMEIGTPLSTLEVYKKINLLMDFV
jgi:hypothetical protein